MDPERYSAECLKCLHLKGVSTTAQYNAMLVQAEVEETVQREFAARELARRRLMYYVMRFEKNYKPGWVHWDICARLERFVKDVEDRKSPRLMLLMPPRHGKSTLASINFPSWTLGKHPEWEIINAAYALSLTADFSKLIRARMRTMEYTSLFKVNLDDDAQQIEGWKTQAGGAYRPVGVGGPLTGKGAHILIIDDPIKDAEEADSETIRKKLHDWYGSTAYTRLAPGGGVLIIQTCWHDDDLVGHELIKESTLRREGVPDAELENWEVVRYPALATSDEYIEESTGKIGHDDDSLLKRGYRLVRKIGEALHPDRFPVALLKKIQRTLTPRHWSALYQQNPVPDEGAYFEKGWMKLYVEPFSFEHMTPIQAWDLALGEKKTNDYTVGLAGYMDWHGNVYIAEMLRARMKSNDTAEAIVELGKRHNAHILGVEYGKEFLAIRPLVEDYMRSKNISITIDEDLKPLTDKISRARKAQAMMQLGQIWFPSNQLWVDDIKHELLRFPGGVHDDIVDALAWLAIIVKKTPRPQPPKKPVKIKSWRDKLPGLMGTDSKQWQGA